MYIDYAAIILSEIVKQKGLEHVTVDDLVAEITPKGRGWFQVFVSLLFSWFLVSKMNLSLNAYHIIYQLHFIIT